MIKSICEHSVDLDLLNKDGWVMDFGSGVDFLFSKEMAKMGMNVISIDPNPKIVDIPNNEKIFYERCALVTDENLEYIDFDIFNDTDAASFVQTNFDVFFVKKMYKMSVVATTVKKLMKKYNIDVIDVLKLDIEGAEYKFLNSLEEPIAKQISIEFHDFRGMNPYYPENNIYYEKLFSKLSKWYNVAKHEITQHPGIGGPLGLNYWDSLLILK
jgi:FkbM family methyltransferase